MFDESLSFSNTLVSLEGTLGIEYEEADKVEDVITKALHRLEEKYGMPFDKDVYTIQSENQMSGTELTKFLNDLQSCLERFSFYIQLKLFHKNLAVTLAEANYLGYDKSRLLCALRYLQDEGVYTKHGKEAIEPLTHQLDQLPLSNIKRIFVCLLMLNKLGVTEGVAVLAQLLYMGGLIK